MADAVGLPCAVRSPTRTAWGRGDWGGSPRFQVARGHRSHDLNHERLLMTQSSPTSARIYLGEPRASDIASDAKPRSTMFLLTAFLICGGCVLPEVGLNSAEDAGTSTAAPQSTESVADAPSPSPSAEEVRPTSANSMMTPEVQASVPVDGSSADESMTASAPSDALDAGTMSQGPTAPTSFCTVGKYLCDGEYLSRCPADGRSLELVASCTSAALCNAEKGRCEQAACAPNSALCEGNVLKQCSADGTKFTDTPCGSARCNQLSARCDECEPYSTKCDGRHTLRNCSGWGLRRRPRHATGSA